MSWMREGPTPDQTTTRWSPSGSFRAQIVEATTGFEPVNRGFADLRVEPLHHVALGGEGTRDRGRLSRRAPADPGRTTRASARGSRPAEGRDRVRDTRV